MPRPTRDDTIGKLDTRAKSGNVNDQRRHFAMGHLLDQLPDCCKVQQESDTRATIYCSRHGVETTVETRKKNK